VHVYHPETVRWCDEGDLPPAYGGKLVVYRCVVRCTCQAGDARPRYIARYEPRRHVLVVFDDVALDVALHHGLIEPILLDFERYRTLSEAIAKGLPKYQAELTKRRQQLGLPPLVKTACPLRLAIKEVTQNA
ncbi:MAG TPA: hypothetical protein PLQ00_17110, partial [Thermoguttaceae bacterium]|nr:hypothetical protein [Thermoguttaceae bacterium]